MIRQTLTVLFFLEAGFIASLGVIVSEMGPYHGGLSTMLGIGYAIAMYIAAFLEYRVASLFMYGLRKTPYYQYGHMELEWYQSASPTTCGCCGGPFMVMAVLFLSSGYEDSPIVFSLFIIAAILSMLGGIATKHPQEREY
jgi:hypothetical protein